MKTKLFWAWFVFCLIMMLYVSISRLIPKKWQIGWNQFIWFMIGAIAAGSPYAIFYGTP